MGFLMPKVKGPHQPSPEEVAANRRKQLNTQNILIEQSLLMRKAQVNSQNATSINQPKAGLYIP